MSKRFTKFNKDVYKVFENQIGKLLKKILLFAEEFDIKAYKESVLI